MHPPKIRFYIQLYVVLCFAPVSGDCINSSPAGKRRIAAEKQLSQLADEASQYTNDAALIDGAEATGGRFKDQIQSAPALILIAAVAICSVFVIVFVSVFVVLQVSAVKPLNVPLSDDMSF